MKEEELLENLEKVRTQLTTLREQQSTVEQEKSELEEIQTQKEELERERIQVHARLKRGVSVLDKQAEETHRLHEDLVDTRAELAELLKELDQIEKQRKAHGDVRERILVEGEHVVRAREALGRAEQRFEILTQEEGSAEGPGGKGQLPPGFVSMASGFKVGLGFFAAGAAIGIVILVVYLLLFVLHR